MAQKNWKMHQHISGIIDACEKDEKKAAMLIVYDGENIMGETHGDNVILATCFAGFFKGVDDEHRNVIIAALAACTTEDGLFKRMRLVIKFKLLKWLLRCKTEQE